MSCCALCGARIERNFYCANTVSCWMSPKAAVASGRRLRLLSTNVTWLLKCTSGFWLSVCWNGVWLCLLFIVVWVCLCLGVFVRFNRLTRCLATTTKEEGECWYLQAWSAVVVWLYVGFPIGPIHRSMACFPGMFLLLSTIRDICGVTSSTFYLWFKWHSMCNYIFSANLPSYSHKTPSQNRLAIGCPL